MNFEELNEKLKIAFNNRQSDFEYLGVEQNKLDELGIGKIELEDEYGGEDCGSTYYKVFYFPDHNIYVKLSGWYQSHYGVDYYDWDDDVKEVKPTTKTITVYE